MPIGTLVCQTVSRADTDGGRAASGAKRKHFEGGIESYDNTLIGYSGVPPSLILSISFHRAAECPTSHPTDLALSAATDGQVEKPDVKGHTHCNPRDGAKIAQGIPIFEGQGDVIHELHAIYVALFQTIARASKDPYTFEARPGSLPPKADHFITHKAFNKLWHTLPTADTMSIRDNNQQCHMRVC